MKVKHNKIVCGLLSTVPALTLLFPTLSTAAQWKVTPSVNFSESISDNVRLQTEDVKQSDAITELSPEISILTNGPRLYFNLNYRMQNLAYRTATSKVQTNHQLASSTKMTLVDQLLFIDGSAAIQQQSLSQFGPQATDNLNLSDNRTEVRTASFSPYLRHSFDDKATSELRYTRDGSSASTGGLASSQSNRVLFNLNSGPAFSTLGWGLQYNKQNVTYTGLKSVESDSSTGTLRYKVSPRFSLNSSVGYEKQDYVTVAEKPAGRFWSAGFSWVPSERTSITSSAGRHYYGNSFLLDASHRARSSMWSLSYNEDVTSTQSQFLLPSAVNTSQYLNNLWLSRLPDPEARQQFVDSFIQDAGLATTLSQNVSTLTNRFFLQKNLQATMALSGVRNTLIFSLYNTKREAKSVSAADDALLGAGIADLNGNTKQTGINVVWNWQLSSRTSATANSGYSRVTSLATGRVDANKTFRVTLMKQLQSKLTGSIEYRRRQNTSNTNAGEIRENAITAFLTERF